MLVLTRKLLEKIVIDGNIIITVVGIANHQVRIGIEAPDSVGIFRDDLLGRARTSEKLLGFATPGVENKTDVR